MPAEHVLGFIEKPLFFICQRPEALTVDLVEDQVNLCTQFAG